jgi:hypothetical protein
LRSQLLGVLAQIAVERGDLHLALDRAHKAVQTASEDYSTDPDSISHLIYCRGVEANILESLGRLDEASALDAESLTVDRLKIPPGALVRGAIKHMAAGEDAEAEQLLRFEMSAMSTKWPKVYSSRMINAALRPHTVLAELLERRGTEEALAEARTLRDGVAQMLARHEVRRAAAVEETRAAAAEAVRQWREERIKAKGEKKGKSKRKGRKNKGKGGGPSSAAAAIEGEQPHEPAGGEAEGVAAGEGAAPAKAEQQAPGGEAQPQGDEEMEKEECAICLQGLELDDDGDPWGDEGGDAEALVLLTCGHRFHEICGDMWCAKCADKGWGVTCPRCRAPYVWVTDD